jgi:gas vesicle protein
MNKSKTLIIGALAGAFTGLVAAMLLQRRAEQSGNETAIVTTGDGMKIGVLVFGLLRAIASLGDDRD